MTDLEIVLPTWNGRDLALACLASIERTVRGRRDAARIETRTIVVDNGSNDGTLDAVRERFPWAEVVALPRNRGFAAGSNAGIARARGGRHVALLNNDTIVLPDALEACVRHLDENPEVGAVGPLLVHPDGRPQRTVHGYPTLLGEIVPAGVLETLAPRRHPSHRRGDTEPFEVEAVRGACLVIRREALDQTGPLAEDYFFFLEETDWLYRMRRAGWRVAHLPSARIVHVQGATSKKRLPLETRIEYHRSLYRFFRTHHGPGQASAVVALRLAKLGLALVALAPLALALPRERQRWRERAALVAWHLCGCPASWGLGRATVEGRA
jgi:GT2 family glycosyltransferase